MKHFRPTYAIAVLLLLCSLFTFTNKTQAQCAFMSTNGYRVTVEVRPIAIVAPTSCPYGYNYNVTIRYNIVVSGNNIPANLYTLQGNLYCGPDALFFSLPKTGAGAVGTLTTTANPYRNTSDCATATGTTLGCGLTSISIEGPGLPAQTSTCAANILAVEILSFNAKIVNDNNVYLKWVAADNNINKSYTIERSTDAANWTAIKTLNSATGSAGVYDYTDESLFSGTYYYRLTQTDASGKTSYSSIIGANITKGAVSKDITVSPNPNPTNQLYLSALGNASDWEMTIVNMASSVVMPTTALKSASVQLPTLSAGVYVIRLRNKINGVQKTLKFVKI